MYLHVLIATCVCYVRTSEIESDGVSAEFSVLEVSEPRLFDSSPLRL